MDNYLKVLGESASSVTVGGYGVIFGGQDLYNETFTKDTDFFLDAVGASPMLMYDHGMNAVLGNTILAKRTTLKPDDVGIFVEAELSKAAEYWEFLGPIIESGKLGMSSGAVAHLVQRGEDKKTIKTWPIAEVSLTMTPAEPRTVGVAAIRSLDDRLTDMHEATPAQAPGNGAPASEIEPFDNSQPAQVRKTEMTEEIRNIDIRDQLNALQADLERRNASDAEVSEWRKSMTETLEAFKKAPVFNPKQASAPEPEKKAFGYAEFAKSLHMLKGSDYAAVKATGMQEAVGSDGGFWVGETVGADMRESIFSEEGFLARCRLLPVGTGNRFAMPQFDEYTLGNGNGLGGVQVYNVAEGASITSSKPQSSLWALELAKKAALVYTTDELEQDASALISRVRSFVPTAIRYLAEDELFSGDGAGGAFLGIKNAAATISVAKESAQAKDTVVIENILSMAASLIPSSAGNAMWVASPKLMPQLYQLSIVGGTASTPVWVNGDMSRGVHNSILGMPLVFSDHCEALGDEGDIYLVDWSYMGLVEKGAVNVAESMHVAFAQVERALRFVWRANAKPLIKTYFTSQNGTDTYSPFVTLAERA